MIRRDGQKPDGSATWVLISQIEHARLAGDLAQHWNPGNSQPIGRQHELIEAIYHHDDGWAEWERAPEVDPVEARPLAFTEMPLERSLAIWQASIEAVASFGLLAPWLVAGHFSTLLQNSAHSTERAACDWLSRYAARRSAWLAAWQAADRVNTRERADTSLGYLQAFDILSLWLCCAPRDLPLQLVLPCGNPLTLTPRSPYTISMAPWPLLVDTLEICVSGSSISKAHYTDNALLAAATQEPIRLRWQLIPS